jgi:uncharacterized membrane protein (DUF485 family)
VDSPADRLRALDAARWRIALSLTAAMTAIYVAFVLLIAYNKSLLAVQLVPGLSLGITLGVVVILAAWALIVIYVRWANSTYDHALADLRREMETHR